jgi:hypothetical protein
MKVKVHDIVRYTGSINKYRGRNLHVTWVSSCGRYIKVDGENTSFSVLRLILVKAARVAEMPDLSNSLMDTTLEQPATKSICNCDLHTVIMRVGCKCGGA